MVLVDCGVKQNIIRCLIRRGVEVIRVPWNYDYTDMQFDGLFLANGPGDPDRCVEAVDILKKQMSMSRKPICGICMGNQLMGKAAGATIYKLKYGHRSHNQPVREVGTTRCSRQRLARTLCEHERRFERGYSPSDQSLVLEPVPSRGLFRSCRYRIYV